jgi:hypothetical protein
MGVLRLGYRRAPSGIATCHTIEGVFDLRCKSIDVPNRTLIKTEHVSTMYTDEMA